MDQKKILIVDDEEAIRIMLMRMIEPLGHQIFDAPDGQAAYEMIADTTFDLIISDLLMPRMDGSELLKKIREDGVDSAFILLTAYGDLPQALSAREKYNIANFLVKPIHNMDQFLFDVESAISRRLLEKENRALLQTFQEMNTVLEAKVEERTWELREKNKELDRLSNFRADVLKVLGHELRTPLAILKAYYHLMEQNLTNQNKAQGPNFQMRMRGSIERLQNRVEKALLLLKSNEQLEFPLVMSQVHLADVCTRVIKRLKPFIEARRIEVEVLGLSDAPTGLWDREKLEEIVEELLINAVRAMQDGSRIELNIDQRGEFAVLEVIDSGVGIPTDQLERVFEPFVTLGKASNHMSGWMEFGAEGIGIGLSTAKRWIDLHGGTIKARVNDNGPGTTMTLELPLRQEKEEASMVESTSHP